MQILDKPQAVVFEHNCRNNINQLIARAEHNDAVCRPHFKTHQSCVVGNWFKEAGISAITVSTPQMGQYFAQHGWKDITIAFPFYRGQINVLNELAKKCRLRLFVDSKEDCQFLSQSLHKPVELMIEIDAGYNRSGIPYDKSDAIEELIIEIKSFPNLKFCGFYTHDGGTYHVNGKDSVQGIIERDLKAFDMLIDHYPDAVYGLGDTPSCSLIDDLSPVTELSPGNLIFYDLMQIEIGSCSFNDLGLLVRVPVVQEKPDDDQCIIHGGAVHFSKERLNINGSVTFGQPVWVDDNGNISKIEDTSLVALSQEHGTVAGLKAIKRASNSDSLEELWICPVHSCLTANLFHSYITPKGKRIEKRILS